MSDTALKTLTGSSRLAVGDETPAGGVQFTFNPDARLLISTCEKPFMSDMEPTDD